MVATGDFLLNKVGSGGCLPLLILYTFPYLEQQAPHVLPSANYSADDVEADVQWA